MIASHHPIPLGSVPAGQDHKERRHASKVRIVERSPFSQQQINDLHVRAGISLGFDTNRSVLEAPVTASPPPPPPFQLSSNFDLRQTDTNG